MKHLSQHISEAFISEAKQVGILYHYSSISNIVKILKDGSLKDKTHNRGYISFTRNGSGIIGQGSNFARIVIDGDKLSNRYKVEPASQASTNGETNILKPVERRQQEERIYSKEVKILDSILYVEIISDYAKFDLTNEEKHFLESKVKLKIVDSFKPIK